MSAKVAEPPARAGTAPADPLAGRVPRPLPPRRGRVRGVARAGLWVLLPAVLLFGLRLFVAEPFGIPSGSMLPTLAAGDRVVANKLAYRLGDPEVGDLIVLKNPTGEILAKRVVAFGGQRVEIRDGVLHVDRRPRKEPYVDYDMVDGFFFGPVTVPEGRIFVLGDNRGDSEDSRDFGAVPRDALIGRVDLRIPSLG